MWCSVNPGIREPEVDLGVGPRPPARHRRVVVVGGGVAGAEAAYRAAERGSAVVLFERGDRIGGRAELAGRRPGRERWGLYLDWLVERLDRHGRRRPAGDRPDASTTSSPSSPTRGHRLGVGAALAVLGRGCPVAGGRRRHRRRPRRPQPAEPGRGRARRRRRGRVRRADRRRGAGRGRLDGHDRHQPHLRRRRGRPDPGLVGASPAQARRRRAARLGRRPSTTAPRGRWSTSSPTSAARRAGSTSSSLAGVRRSADDAQRAACRAGPTSRS